MLSVIILDSKSKKIFGVMINRIQKKNDLEIKKEVLNFLDNIAIEQAQNEIDDYDIDQYGSEEEAVEAYSDHNLYELQKRVMWVVTDNKEAELASQIIDNEKSSKQLFDEISNDMNTMKYLF